jgi:hypothetical protein
MKPSLSASIHRWSEPCIVMYQCIIFVLHTKHPLWMRGEELPGGHLFQEVRMYEKNIVEGIKLNLMSEKIKKRTKENPQNWPSRFAPPTAPKSSHDMTSQVSASKTRVIHVTGRYCVILPHDIRYVDSLVLSTWAVDLFAGPQLSNVPHSISIRRTQLSRLQMR